MAAFTGAEINANWAIWDLFQNGAVVLFKNPDQLRTAVAQLTAGGYRVHEVDCQTFEDESALLKVIVEALGIACYPGGVGLDGFNDFVFQIEFQDCTGVVLVLHRFDVVRKRSNRFARDVLDILADNQRYHMLFGYRLLTLVQTMDPKLDGKIGPVGGFTPAWNSHEWFNKDRGLG